MIYACDIKVDVRKSNTDENYVIIQKESKGKTKSNAKSNAKKIRYEYEIVDNTIILDAFFLSEFKNLWKDEEINIVFYITEGVTIYFDNSIKNFLYRVDNDTEIYDKDMANHHFMMTDKTLKCTDCETEIEAKKNDASVKATI